MPVLPGMPVITRRRSPGRTRGLIHATSLGVGRNGRVDEQPLERMIEIPVIVQMLVVPDDLAVGRVQRQRRVVIEVLLVDAAQDELRRRDRDRRADVDAIELGVVARHHPRADVPALLHRHVAPRLVAGLAFARNRARAPQLLAGRGVVRRDDARLVRRAGWHWRPVMTLPLATIGPELARAGSVGSSTGVSHTSLPVRASIAYIVLSPPASISVVPQIARLRFVPPLHAFGELALVLPEQRAGLRVERLHVVAAVRHVHDAVVDERRRLLDARPERVRPHLRELRDVALVDLVERAVAPAVRACGAT